LLERYPQAIAVVVKAILKLDSPIPADLGHKDEKENAYIFEIY